jgi:acetylglutamate kinase
LSAPLLSNFGLIEDLLGTAVAPEFERKDKKKEKKELSYAKISRISKIDKDVIKDLIKTSKFRVHSPVAQYAYLSI